MAKQPFKNWIASIMQSPLLEDQQSENLGIMPQAWRSWLQETMKTCCRWDLDSSFILHSHVQVAPSVFYSVLSPYLKDCSLNHMMRPLPPFCSPLLNGTAWLSSECIPSHQLTSSGNVPPTSGISWGVFRHTHAAPSWPGSFQKRRLLVVDTGQKRMQPGVPNRLLALRKRHWNNLEKSSCSISSHTSCTRLGIMWGWFFGLGLQILIRLNLCVPAITLFLIKSYIQGWYRASLNTAESNGFMLVPTKIMLFIKWPALSAVNRLFSTLFTKMPRRRPSGIQGSSPLSMGGNQQQQKRQSHLGLIL